MTADGRQESGLQERRIGSVRVLFGARGGRYPQGNALHVEGREERAIIDPGLGVVARREALPAADRVLNSHCHEDHVAGNHLYRAASWHLHELDLPGIRSLDGLMAIYGYPGALGAAMRKLVQEEFHYQPRADAIAFRDGDVFELGGGVRVRVIHAPGHTRGHSFFHLEPDDVLYLGDVDLTSFGPYYGDAWSDLEDFERTLRLARGLRARHYATYHHVGVLDGREAFLARLDRFEAVIGDRERRLLEFLAEPHDLDEIARHRFVYRPQDEVPWAEPVEQRSMGQHLARLAAAGRVEEVEPGRWRRAAASEARSAPDARGGRGPAAKPRGRLGPEGERSSPRPGAGGGSGMGREHSYEARVIWSGSASGGTTSYAAYSREYRVEIAGRPALRGSADPLFRGDGALHNPEDLLVAALSTCHLLSYLGHAARAGLVVLGYEDRASGTLLLEGGGGRFTEVVLHPVVSVAAGSDLALARRLHERAHADCFIASSVNFPVRCEPTLRHGIG